MDKKRAVILFADIQKSTEFGFTQPVERYNAVLREFHALARRVVDAYAEQHGLDGDRLMKGLKGDECCLFFLGGKPGQDECSAIELAVRLKEEWKQSDFAKRARAGAETTLYPLVDLRIGIGAGDVMMQYDQWADCETPEGIAVSEAKRIEGMADQAENTLIMVNWEVHQACKKAIPDIAFGDGMRLTGKGIPESLNTPVYPVTTYPPWSRIQEAIAPEPETAWELFDRGLALISSGDLDGAIAQYRKAVGLREDFFMAWCGIGVAYSHKGEYDQAIDSYQKAVQSKPDYHEAWFYMGVAYSRKGEYDRAIESYQKAVQSKPDYHEAWFNMGVGYSRKRDYCKSIECYEKAVAIWPALYRAHSNMGIAYAAVGQYQLAIQSHQKAVNLRPNLATLWFNLACAYSLYGAADQAVAALNQAIRLDVSYREEAKANSLFGPFPEDDRFREAVYGDEV